VCLFKIKINDSPILHVLKWHTSIQSSRPEHGSFRSGHHLLSLHSVVSSVFQRTRQFSNFSESKQIYWSIATATHLWRYLATFQIFFAAFFKELAFIREMRGLESRSRTSRSRSRLLWQSLGLEVWAVSRSRRLRSRLHHW